MKTITFSRHAEVRVNTRLGKLVTCDEVLQKINKISSRLNNQRNWVLIKKMSYIEISDESVKPDGIARGDTIVALVENWIIESVLLRKSWSQSAEYRKIIH